MRLHVEGKDIAIMPHLPGRLAKRLNTLNRLRRDIREARLTLVQHEQRYEARVRLIPARKTLHAMQHDNSRDTAIGAALQNVEQALRTGQLPAWQSRLSWHRDSTPQ